MAASARGPQEVYQESLMNHLISMARAVEVAVQQAIEALLDRDCQAASQTAREIFRNEPGIDEMEIAIDEQAVRLLRGWSLPEADVRLIVATLRINNDLERMGDLAVNIGERVVSLSGRQLADAPSELEPMSIAVRAMVSKSLGALRYGNLDLARQVLQSDDEVDRYRDRIFTHLLAEMTKSPASVPANIEFVLASRCLERIADHATNIAEDVVFWVRGLDVRHGRGRDTDRQPPPETALDAPPSLDE